MENMIPETDSADANKKIEAIIRAVAVKHGIALGRNDPILVLHTLNELLINELARKQDDLIQQFQVSLEEAANQWSKNMETKAAEILGEMRKSHLPSGAQARLFNELIENQISAIALSISDKLNEATVPQQRRTSQHIKSLNGQLKLMKRLVFFNIAGSILALTAGVLIMMVWM